MNEHNGNTCRPRTALLVTLPFPLDGKNCDVEGSAMCASTSQHRLFSAILYPRQRPCRINSLSSRVAPELSRQIIMFRYDFTGNNIIFPSLHYIDMILIGKWYWFQWYCRHLEFGYEKELGWENIWNHSLGVMESCFGPLLLQSSHGLWWSVALKMVLNPVEERRSKEQFLPTSLVLLLHVAWSRST